MSISYVNLKKKISDSSVELIFKNDIKVEIEKRYNPKTELDESKCYFVNFNKHYNLESNKLIEQKREIKEILLEAYHNSVEQEHFDVTFNNMVFDNIKTINFLKEDRESILIIGYEDNYINDIVKTILLLGYKAPTVVNKKIYNLLLEKEFSKAYIRLEDLLDNYKYKAIILDIPGITSKLEFDNTKKIIELIRSKNKNIIFLIEDIDQTPIIRTSIEHTIGENELNYCIDKMNMIYRRSSTIEKLNKLISD